MGYTPYASNFIPQFDALLITSQSEGIPQVIFESFYHQKPVISTSVGGIPEIIQDGINGFLAPRHDFKTLAEKIIYLFDNKELIQNLTTISYKNLIENFTTQQMAQKTLEVYKTVSNGD